MKKLYTLVLILVVSFQFTAIHAQYTDQCPPLVGTNSYGQFNVGHLVAISADGKTAAIVASSDDNIYEAIIVYRWQGNQWVQQTLIKDMAPYGSQSIAISADGNTIAFSDSYNYKGGTFAGIYVYENGNWHLQEQVPVKQTGSVALALSYDGNTMLFAYQVWIRTLGHWSLQATLAPTDRTTPTSASCDTANHFSCSTYVALSANGNTAVIGDNYQPDTATNAWVFVRNGTTWSQQGSRLEGTGSKGNNPNNYTARVAISGDGNTLALGVPYSSNSRSTWIFTRTGNVWAQQGTGPLVTQTFDNGPPGIFNCLSYDGNTLLTEGGSYHEFCYWQRTGTTWAQQGYTFPIKYASYFETIGDQGGATTALAIDSSGTRMFIGDDQFHDQVGAAFYFTRTGTTWTQQGGNLTGTGLQGGGAQGGAAISRDGNYLADGGFYNDGGEGGVWMFKRNGPAWTQIAKLKAPDNAWQQRNFGYSVSLSADGSTLAVGASYSNDSFSNTRGMIQKGNVYVYTLNGGTYTLQGDSLTWGTYQQFGYEVSISDDGNTLLVGADTGAFVYVRNAGVWSLQAGLIPPGSGWYVKLSGDGNTALVGGNLTGTFKGNISIYHRTGTTWAAEATGLYNTQVTLGDWYPWSIAISQNGNVVAASDIFASNQTGRTFIYTRNAGVWSLTDSTIYDGGYTFDQGNAIALSSSGDSLAVGSKPGLNSGFMGLAIYVRSGNTWNLNILATGKAPAWNTMSANGNLSLIATGANNGTTGEVRVLTRTNMQDYTVVTKPATCLQSGNGKIFVTMSGGVPPYHFSWSNGAPDADSAVNLAAGNYLVTITDNGGNAFVRQYTVIATDSLNLSYSTAGFNCNTSEGYIAIAPSGGTSPFTYNWNTAPVQTTDTAANLQPGNYQFSITDNSGCVYAGSAQLTGSAYWSEITTTQPNCGSNGSAAVTIYGGTAPFSYSWSSGSHSANTGLVGAGTYTLTLSDATGCSATGTTILNSGCDDVITGRVFLDRNGNCTQDVGEPGVPNLTMIATQGTSVFYGNTNSTGDYEVLVPAGGAYSVSIGSSQECSYNVCPGGTYPAQATLTGTGDTATSVNLPLLYSGIDLAVNAGYTTPNPGFTFDFTIYYGNLQDSVVPTGTVTLVYDANLVFSSADVPYTTFSSATRTITWNVANIGPLDSVNQTVGAHFTIPSSVKPQTKLTMDCSITPITGDCNPLNNDLMLVFPVAGSLDPNFKLAYPADTLTGTDSVVTYTIHFQNTGEAPTHYVEITDTLSADVDPATVRTVAASHYPYNFTLSKNGILDWLFSPLSLPSRSVDSINSQAFVTYQVKLKPGRATGTVINNTASIYFDYNTPVQTNTVKNVVNNTGVGAGVETVAANNTVQVYPNPNSVGSWQLSVGNNLIGAKLDMYNIEGQLVYHSAIRNQQSAIPTTGLPSGVYFLRISTGNEVQTVKVVKE